MVTKVTDLFDWSAVPDILRDIAQVCFASMFVEQFFVDHPRGYVIILGLVLSVLAWLTSLRMAKKFKGRNQ